MPVSFQEDTKKTSSDAPWFEEVTGDAGFRGYSTQKSEDQLMSNITAALGRLGGKIIGVRRGKWIDDKKRQRYIYEFNFSMAGPGDQGAAMGVIQVAAFPIRKWTEKKDMQARKMALYVLQDMLETTFNFQRITPKEVATLIPFMLSASGMTLSESYLTGRITKGFMLPEGQKRPKQDGDVIEAEVV